MLEHSLNKCENMMYTALNYQDDGFPMSVEAYAAMTLLGSFSPVSSWFTIHNCPITSLSVTQPHKLI